MDHDRKGTKQKAPALPEHAPMLRAGKRLAASRGQSAGESPAGGRGPQRAGRCCAGGEERSASERAGIFHGGESPTAKDRLPALGGCGTPQTTRFDCCTGLVWKDLVSFMNDPHGETGFRWALSVRTLTGAASWKARAGGVGGAGKNDFSEKSTRQGCHAQMAKLDQRPDKAAICGLTACLQSA